MLSLERRVGQRVFVGDSIVITTLETKWRGSLCIDADQSVTVRGLFGTRQWSQAAKKLLIEGIRFDDRIVIGNEIVVAVCCRWDRECIRLGIEAPPEIRIWREEVTPH